MQGIRIYYREVDVLIIDLIAPLLRPFSDQLEFWFWERGCLGGKHLSLYWKEHTDADIDAIEFRSVLIDRIELYIAHNPSSPPGKEPSSAAVERLASLEGRRLSPVHYQVHCDSVIQCRREEDREESLPLEIESFLFWFLGRFRAIATECLRLRLPKEAIALDLLTLFTMECYSTPEIGCLTFVGHWSNYDQWFEPRVFLDKVIQAQELRRDNTLSHVAQLLNKSATVDLEVCSVHVLWRTLLSDADTRIRGRLSSFTACFPRLTLMDLDVTRQSLRDKSSPSGRFLDRLYSSPAYMGVGTLNEASLTRTRILVNCLYYALTTLGLSAYQRVLNCYCLLRAVQSIRNVDYLEVLTTRISLKEAPACHDDPTAQRAASSGF